MLTFFQVLIYTAHLVGYQVVPATPSDVAPEMPRQQTEDTTKQKGPTTQLKTGEVHETVTESASDSTWEAGKLVATKSSGPKTTYHVYKYSDPIDRDYE